MSKKLIVFDIDGTLVNSKNNILPSSKLAIKTLQEKGHIVTIATGRSRFLVNDILSELNLDTYVLCNGAAVFYKEKQFISKPLDKELLRKLSQFMNEAGMDLSLTALDKMVRETSNHDQRMKLVMKTLGAYLPEKDNNFEFLDKNPIYQGLGFYNFVKDGTFEKHFPQLRFVRWHQECVDIIARESSKAVSVLALAAHIGIDNSNIIAFGDGNNDLEILENVGLGIAMGNASDKVKSVADMVTDSNENDGIYKALKKLELV